MISITCTNCQASLSIDDAFAGGVCRCQHCGTIQTVPSKKSAATAAGLGVKTPKTLYQKRARDVSAGTGLDELAEVVTSSGLAGSGSGLSSRSARPAGTRVVPKSNNTTMIVGVVAIVVIAVLVTLLVVVSQRDRGATAGTPTGTGTRTGSVRSGAGAPAPRVPTDPTFCGVKLDHPSVVYLLDRGSSTQSAFGSLKEATLKSIESLGPDRRFQIIFWDNDQDVGTFPALMAFANENNVVNVRRLTEDVYAFGATDAQPALEKAMPQRPAAIVIATGKGADLDESFVQMVKDTTKGADVVIHTFAIGGAGQSTALKTVAEMTGGQYREPSEGELSRFGQ
jgi:von Willebrand factor type A domain